ncbi:MAG TPA: peptidylprolyl isomerase, partial [Thermoguttaceae bacterium]|nr:peptidylprolyl isomerase [Thermoguttaceae bacterium]
ATARPTTWPGQPAQYPDTGQAAAGGAATAPVNGPAAGNGNPSGAASPAETKRLEDIEILGRVGTEVILAGDVMAIFVHEKLDSLDQSVPEEYRERILMSWMPRAVLIKMMYLEATRTIPEENLPKVKKQVEGYFRSKALPEMLKRTNVKTEEELEQKLADLGTSLAWQQQLFVEQAIGQQWMGMEVKFDEPVSPEDLYIYYTQHLSDYEHKARAKWEELMVSFAKNPSREAAYQKISQLGNQVMAGLPFAEAARRGSDGSTATDGGARAWTTQGSLVAEQLDKAIFGADGQPGLPVGQMSQILESEQGFHIVRVVERREAYRTAFEEVQEKIRKTIQEERGKEKQRVYITKLQDSTPVWTIYDARLAKKNARPAGDETQKR